MLLLAHFAAGYFAALGWNKWTYRKPINPYLAAFGGLLPDLMDKSIALILPGWDTTSRTIGHSFAFFLLLVLLSRGYPFAPALALGVLSHQVLDLPWTYPATFLWPLLGPEFTQGSQISLRSYLDRLRQPEYLVEEAIAAVTLGAVLWWHFFGKKREMEPSPDDE